MPNGKALFWAAILIVALIALAPFLSDVHSASCDVRDEIRKVRTP